MRAGVLLLALLPLYAAAVMPLRGGAGVSSQPRQPELVIVNVGQATTPLPPRTIYICAARPRTRESVGRCSRLDVSVWMVTWWLVATPCGKREP